MLETTILICIAMTIDTLIGKRAAANRAANMAEETDDRVEGD